MNHIDISLGIRNKFSSFSGFRRIRRIFAFAMHTVIQRVDASANWRSVGCAYDASVCFTVSGTRDAAPATAAWLRHTPQRMEPLLPQVETAASPAAVQHFNKSLLTQQQQKQHQADGTTATGHKEWLVQPAPPSTGAPVVRREPHVEAALSEGPTGAGFSPPAPALITPGGY